MIRTHSQNLRPNPKEEESESALAVAFKRALERKKAELARQPERQDP